MTMSSLCVNFLASQRLMASTRALTLLLIIQIVKVKTTRSDFVTALATPLKQSFEAPLVKSLVSAKKLLIYNSGYIVIIFLDGKIW